MESLLLFIFWMLFAITCSSLAERKNRNQFLWGILGFIFGIFALLVIALLPEVKNNNDTEI